MESPGSLDDSAIMNTVVSSSSCDVDIHGCLQVKSRGWTGRVKGLDVDVLIDT